jgi:hypothetical protein
MSYQQITIPEEPSYQQLQELQYEVTKRMNTYLEMTVNQVSQTGAPGFVFAGTNAKLSLPTLGVT